MVTISVDTASESINNRMTTVQDGEEGVSSQYWNPKEPGSVTSVERNRTIPDSRGTENQRLDGDSVNPENIMPGGSPRNVVAKQSRGAEEKADDAQPDSHRFPSKKPPKDNPDLRALKHIEQIK